MLLEGKKLLVTGVLMDSSIAFHIAKLAQEQGAEVVLTSFGRTMKITTAIARRLPETPPVVELDVTSDDDLAALADRVREHVPHLDGVVHSIGFAPQGAFNFMEAGWDDVSTAVQVSAYSLGLPDQGGPAPDVRGRQRRRAHLRRPLRVAGLRLDGRGEGRVRVDEPLPRARPRAEGDPLQHRRGRADPHDRREVDPRLRAVRGGVGQPLARWAGTSTTPSPPPRRASPCSRTGSPPPPARWCTSTAASTRWASSLSSAQGSGSTPAAH